MSSKNVNFIKSASLIVLSASKNAIDHDFKLMLLKRNKQMRVAPGFSVFPGGKLDPHIDGSLKWLEIFNATNKPNHFASLISANSIGSRQLDRPTQLPIEVAYRLCAIRETFEETGILLARDRSSKISNEASSTTDYYQNLANLDKITSWHEKVLNDSEKFIEMFKELDLTPSIFGLHEWANWLTPAHEKTRFDTFFFACFLDRVPDERFLLVNKQEIDTLEFWTPSEVIEKYKRGEIKFIPPQLYESHRLARFKKIDELAKYSLHRQKYGLQPWLPKFTKDGLVGFLPGDYMYDEAEYLSQTAVSKTDSNQPLNRILKRRDENTGMNYYEIVCNSDFDVRSKYFHTYILNDPVQDCSSTPSNQ